ncbi:type VI secretion system-associated protein TagF [uncultured Cohaesibacter sp.]|uniref:type VI secretion system-associated protein TagF n=1 Tax=uncultured Cohaesibacter sp. TaxID=1002546 RepID=UPI0029C6D7E0|nr:type VI secretion system-associated protein TagF [uncultured Cohaesibacter sp.]
MQEPAYFGKIPTVADFLHQGLSMSKFDEWADVAASWFLGKLDDADPDWKARVVSAPLWRFLIPDGVIAESGFYGVMAGSMDKARRVFPFVVLIPQSIASASLDHVFRLSRILDGLESQTLGFLAGETDQTQFRDQLAGLMVNQPVLNSDAAPIDAGFRRYPATCFSDCHVRPDGLSVGSSFVLDRMPDRPKGGGAGDRWSLWWHEGASNRPAEVCIVNGLPYGPSFVSLFLANWNWYGWREETTTG